MSIRAELKIGDRIFLTKVPLADQNKTVEDGLDTAKIIEQIIEEGHILNIDEVDEYGQPWFSVDLMEDGELSTHSIALMDDDSWEKLPDGQEFENPEQQAIANQIQAVTEKYAEEYQALAIESEALYEAKLALEQKYKDLDDKSGLHALYAQYAQFFKD